MISVQFQINIAAIQVCVSTTDAEEAVVNQSILLTIPSGSNTNKNVVFFTIEIRMQK